MLEFDFSKLAQHSTVFRFHHQDHWIPWEKEKPQHSTVFRFHLRLYWVFYFLGFLNIPLCLDFIGIKPPFIKMFFCLNIPLCLDFIPWSLREYQHFGQLNIPLCLDFIVSGIFSLVAFLTQHSTVFRFHPSVNVYNRKSLKAQHSTVFRFHRYPLISLYKINLLNIPLCLDFILPYIEVVSISNPSTFHCV